MGLELMPASNKGFYATAPCGAQVEIKATRAPSVAFRREPEHVIAIKILPDGTFEEIFNGPGSLVWAQFSGKPEPSNGQYQISLTRLRTISESVLDEQWIQKRATQ